MVKLTQLKSCFFEYVLTYLHNDMNIDDEINVEIIIINKINKSNKNYSEKG